MLFRHAVLEDAPAVAALVGELLTEIVAAIGEPVFHFDMSETTERLERFMREERYVVLVASDSAGPIGFITLYESFALYAEGVFGTIPELYVRPAYRSRQVGRELLSRAKALARTRDWTRLEVTTPPLPAFDRTLTFYEREGFVISGGRKLKLAL
ncbi:GNAT family N-acetyltransferase [Thiorhodococcus mannitoliphagus]|uniref:GNAT family N-acetyltransferase n=1 Tax=Thiorhodococcus mannitoliphagus TaxID=329406 RepID=A0A6P1DYR1_9GAMM|nr:GNAT family N-acetyltransferase [Thiorhodococcus mannitoliphagus]NEX22161.1 GNAT family N-acetyltransferase [Thiorhodococcus mannitoliphagus]